MHAWFWSQNCFLWGNLRGSESLLAQFYCLQFFLRLIQLKALDVSGSLEPAMVFALEMCEFECQSTCKCFTGYQLRLVEEMPFLANRFGLCTNCVDGWLGLEKLLHYFQPQRGTQVISRRAHCPILKRSFTVGSSQSILTSITVTTKLPLQCKVMFGRVKSLWINMEQVD